MSIVYLFRVLQPRGIKKKYILAKLQATVELIRYYGVAYICPMVKFTFAQGKFTSSQTFIFVI